MMRHRSSKTLKRQNRQGVMGDWLLWLDEPGASSGAQGAELRAPGEEQRRSVRSSGAPERSSAAGATGPGPGPGPQPVSNYPERQGPGGQQRRSSGGLRTYTCELSIDTNTAHRNLKLSDNNSKATAVREEQPYPEHPRRFDAYVQLLCSPPLTARCYWEFEWQGWVEVSVSYAGIGRRGTGDACRFGFNAQSWVLECCDSGYCVRHETRRTLLSPVPVCGRAAVFLDVPAGTLSFCAVFSDKLIHLHTFSATFTGPLFAGFGLLAPGSLVSLCVAPTH